MPNMAASVRLSVTTSDGTEVRLCLPDPDEVRISAEHAGFVFDAWGDDDSAIEPADVTTAFTYLHPVWWRSPFQCREDSEGDCNCGRVTLLEVLDTLDDPQLRQCVLDAHLEANREAWDHYWSGESLLRGGCTLGGACVECLTGGDDHLSELSGEANELAAELGSAIAAFHTLLLLGESMYPRRRSDPDPR